MTVDQLQAAQAVAPIASVQNLYNLGEPQRRGAARLQRGQRHRVHPVVPARYRGAGQAGRPARASSPPGAARRPSQLALAWLLHRSPVMLPIPGTSSVSHLEDNVAAAGIALSESEYASLEAAVR